MPDPATDAVTEVTEAVAPTEGEATLQAAIAGLPALGEGQLLVGAAKSSIAPRPEDMQEQFPGARWETDPNKCKVLDPVFLERLASQTQTELDHLVAAGSPWPENPSCIYQGGFSIGPANPVSAYDAELGLWVRTLALGDGTDTMLLTVIDGEGWLWDYAQKCDDCGSKQIAAALAEELKPYGVTEKSFVLHATHSHASPDFIGGWGFVPDWYMAQVTETIKQTARNAVAAMEPAVVEVGEVEARAHNGERRDTYRSAEEQQLGWLRAIAVDQEAPATEPAATEPTTSEPAGNGKGKKPSPSPSPSPSEPPAADEPRVIATLGAYAAHPTTKGTNGGVAHPDWPGVFEKKVEDRFGGIGLHFMTGLGNMSASGGTDIGNRLGNALPPVGAGRLLTDTDLVLEQTTWSHPVTNAPLDALGTPGFFDRQFDPAPATVQTGKSPDTAPCTSAAPQSVELPVTAARIGKALYLTTGPGELFSNVTNTLKERRPGAVVLPLAQSNDALGYMPQSFELNPVGQQGLGFAFGGYVFVNYEDSYAVDRCIGDKVLEETIALMGAVDAPPAPQ